MAWRANPINGYTLYLHTETAFNIMNTRGLLRRPEIRNWFNSTWRNWLLSQFEHVTSIPTTVTDDVRAQRFNIVGGGFSATRVQDVHIPLQELLEHVRINNRNWRYEINIAGNWCSMHSAWQWRLLLQPEVDWWSVNTVDAQLDVYDWMLANPNELPKDLSRLDAYTALCKTEQWHQQQKVEKSSVLKTPGARTQIAPGVWRLDDAASILHEGATMHHCVGGYWREAVARETVFYHVDGPVPATVQSTDGFIVQKRGVCNAAVDLSTEVLVCISKDSKNVTVQKTDV